MHQTTRSTHKFVEDDFQYKVNMPTKITVKKPRSFIRKAVNTPLRFSKLTIPEIQPVTLPLKVTKKKKPVNDVANSFFTKQNNVLEDDQVHIRRSLANSMESFVISHQRKGICKPYLQEFKDGMVKVHLSAAAELKDAHGNPMTAWQFGDFHDDGKGGIAEISDSTKTKVLKLCQKMADAYVDPIFNKAIEKLCNVHFSNYQDDGTAAQDLYRQRYFLSDSLKKEAQCIIGQCYQIGVVSGRCDGKSDIEYIVGSISKDTKVYSFKTASERKSMLEKHGGRTSFNRKLPVEVMSVKEYLTAVNEKVLIAKEFWKHLGDHTEKLVQHRLAELLPLEDSDSETSQWDDTEFGAATLSVFDSELIIYLREAMLFTFELGYDVGLQRGQKYNKSKLNVGHDPWIYSFVGLGGHGIFIGTKSGIEFDKKRAREVNDGHSPKNARTL